jgi:hypothetical protein
MLSLDLFLMAMLVKLDGSRDTGVRNGISNKKSLGTKELPRVNKLT